MKETIIRNIKKARKNSLYSQTEAAAKLGLHPSAIAKMEQGKRDASVEELEKMAALYQVSVIWLMDLSVTDYDRDYLKTML